MSQRLVLFTIVWLANVAALAAPATILFSEDFESGRLDTNRWTVQTFAQGEALVTTNFSPASGTSHLILDDQLSDDIYSSVAASFSVDLAGYTNRVLSFMIKNLNDEVQTNQVFEGVMAFAVNRSLPLLSFAGLPTEYTRQLIDLEPVLKTFILGTNSRVTITFTQTDNFSAPFDGMALDDIQITGEKLTNGHLVAEFPNHVREDAGSAAGLLFLDPPPSGPIEIKLRSSNPEVLNVPDSITADAGESLVSIPIFPKDNQELTGPQTVFLELSASGYDDSESAVIIDENERVVLNLDLAESVSESEFLSGTVTISQPLSFPLTVEVKASPQGQVSLFWVPLIIEAGHTNSSFTLNPNPNLVFDGDRTIEITATSAISDPVSRNLKITDDERPTLSLLYSDWREGALQQTAVLLGGISQTSLLVTLTVPAGFKANPNPVLVRAGTQQSEFLFVSVPDDDIPQGNRPFPVVLSAPGFLTSTQMVNEIDDDATALTIAFNSDLVPIGTSVGVTVEVKGTNLTDRAYYYNKPLSIELIDAQGQILAIPLAVPTPEFSSAQWLGSVVLTNRAAGLRLRARSGNLVAVTPPFDTYLRVEMPIRDIAADPGTNIIYATTLFQRQFHEGEVIALDASTGQLLRSIPVGNQPDRLAVTDDGSVLYVDLKGTGEIAQVDLKTFSLLRKFIIRTNSLSDLAIASDLQTVRGLPGWLLVSSQRTTGLPQSEIALFIDGIRQKEEVLTALALSGSAIEPSSEPGTSFAVDLGTFNPYLRQISVAATGVREASAMQLLNTYLSSAVSDRDLVVTGNGLVIDGLQKQILATLPVAGLPLPDLANERLYFLTSSGISIYDSVNYLHIADRTIATVFGSSTHLIRYGINGLAFADYFALHLIESDRIVPSNASADLGVSIQSSGGSILAGQTLQYIINVTNAGPNTASSVFVRANLSSGQTPTNNPATDGSITVSGNTINFFAGGLPAGGSTSFSFTVVATQAGTILCETDVSSASRDFNRDNQSARKFTAVEYHLLRELVARLEIPALDLIADPVRQILYASLSELNATTPSVTMNNRVVAFDPVNGRTKLTIPLPEIPSIMTISDDGKYLYVSLKQAGKIARCDLETGKSDLTIDLGTSNSYRMSAEDMVVVPGKNRTLIVSRQTAGLSPRHAGVAVFDDAIQRPVTSQPYTGSNRIEPSAQPDIYFGYNTETSEYGFRLLRLSPEGIKEEKSAPVTPSYDLKADGDLVFFSSGLLVNGANFQRLNMFSLFLAGTPLPEVSRGRVYYLNAGGITVFNTTNFSTIGSITLPEPPGSTPVPFIKWGGDGLAWLYQNRIYILRTSLRGDTDGDGLDDAWEIAQFADLSVTGKEDYDSDGASNRTEFLAGTDPKSASDRPFLSIHPANEPHGQLQVQWIQSDDFDPSTVTCLISKDLITWQPVRANFNMTSLTNHDGRILVTLPLPGISGESDRFYFARLGTNLPPNGSINLAGKTLQLMYQPNGGEKFAFINGTQASYENTDTAFYTYDAATGRLHLQRGGGQTYLLIIPPGSNAGSTTVTFQQPGTAPENNQATYTLSGP